MISPAKNIATAHRDFRPAEAKDQSSPVRAHGMLAFDDAKSAEERGLEKKTGPDSSSVSAAAALTSIHPIFVTHVILKFTTLSDGNEEASFAIDQKGGSIGRSSKNAISVPSDSTLMKEKHATLEWVDGQFHLLDFSEEFHAAVRLGVGQAADRWPLRVSATFSAGNSIFFVTNITSQDETQSVLHLHVKSGPKRGSNLVVDTLGATVGRSNENSICISDRELSRRHSQITFDKESGDFFVSDLGSTNGTYVQLVGPYAGRYPLSLNDHILVGRTGFSINRFDYGISEETGFRRTMEDKCIIVQDLKIPGLIEYSGLGPQTWLGVYDGHGGPEASAFLHQRLHGLVSKHLSSAASTLCDYHAANDLQALDASIKEAITTAFLAADNQFISGLPGCQAGSTGTTALIIGNRLYCANVGDSRTVLCRDGKAIPLSTDHKPSREDEAMRIKAAGGFIINKRVMGELAVSRAFGDCEFKKGISEILGDEATEGMSDDTIEQVGQSKY